MGVGTLTDRAAGEVIGSAHPNEIHQALRGDFVGRNASNVPTAGQNHGTIAFPWGVGRFNSIVVNGSALDTSQIAAPANRIVSGASRSGSSQPQFLKASGAAPSVTIEGASTNLVLEIDGAATTVNTDIVKDTLTVAPSANNTALVNAPEFEDQEFTKVVGENGSTIPIDNAGSELTSRIGQILAFKLGTEIFIGFMKSATEITDVYRGYFFDSTQTQIERETLADNDIITLMSLGWIFIEDNATTVDVTYTTPQTQTIAPVGAIAGDYWFDITNQTWQLHNGVSFLDTDRTLVGVVVVDGTNAIATRSFDFHKLFSEQENLELEKQSASIIQTARTRQRVSVYGTSLIIDYDRILWDASVDFESGVSEAASTLFYLYLTEEGRGQISNLSPFDRPDLKGLYHPFHTWRFIGTVFNDSSSDFEDPNDTQVAETSLIHGFKTVGSVGDLGQLFAGHRFELTEPGTLKSEVLAYYKFASGALETDEVGAFDLTPNGTPAPANTTGILGDTFAADYDGANSFHTQATLLDIFPSALAIDFWVKPDDGQPPGSEVFLNKTQDAGSVDLILCRLDSSGILRWNARQGSSDNDIFSSTVLPNGVVPWTYISLTWDTTNGSRMFINSVLEAVNSSNTTLAANGSFTDFFIGANTGATDKFAGKIALFRLRDKILTQKDVDIGYSSRLDLNPPLQGKDFDLHGTLKPGGDSEFERGYPVSGLEVSRDNKRIYRVGGLITGLESTDTLKIKARF